MKRQNGPAHFFTRIEFLFLAAILCVGSTIALPLFIRASNGMKLLACTHSLLQLGRANVLYAADYGCYSPAATADGRRWHGMKMSKGNYTKIDPNGGYLSPFLNEVEICPEIRKRLTEPSPPSSEKGGYGYGYNFNIGSLRNNPAHDFWEPACESSGIRRDAVRNPGRTVAFADTACYVNAVGEPCIKGNLTEYAFSVSFHTINRGFPLGGINDPTLHFRHSGNVNVAWVDGHVTQESMTYSKGKWKFHDLGFIGTPSENLFEP